MVLSIRTMTTNFSPVLGVLCFIQSPSIVMFSKKGFYVSASGAIQCHDGPLVIGSCWLSGMVCDLHWIFWDIRRSVTGIDISELHASRSETQEMHEFVNCRCDMTEIMLKAA